MSVQVYSENRPKQAALPSRPEAAAALQGPSRLGRTMLSVTVCR